MSEQRKVLMAYASKYGATTGIAEAIAATLRKEGVEADVRPAKEVHDLSGYNGIVLGAPVFAGRWMSEASGFVRRHRESLKGLPVAYFTVGVTLPEKVEEWRQEHRGVIEKARLIAPEVEPITVEMFNGAVDKAKLGLFIRLLLTIMRVQEGDFRDWEAIRSWAKELASKMLAERPQ